MFQAVRPFTLGLLVLSGLAACAGAPTSSPRPLMRENAPLADPVPQTDARTEAGFETWLADFRSRALANGISASTWARATRDMHYNPTVIKRDRSQAEFTRSIWDYLDSAVSDQRIATGRQMLAEHRRTLDGIEARYGVDREVVVAIWGMESNFGSHRGTTAILPALATLSYDGRRGEFFAKQFLAALQIIQAGDIDPAHMTGSWAGAMGHTQFMPTSYLEYAVDFTGDGRRDIWSNDPADALASTAAYLKRSGWVKGQPWGEEVILPRGFDYNLVGKGTKRNPEQWAAMGVRRATGGSLGAYGPGSILLPAGAKGPAFLIFGNFRAISRYNNADAYVLGVGHLSDRLKGRGPFVQDWPRTGKPLNLDQKIELQKRLTARGFDTQGTDGKIGPDSTAAIIAYQRSAGLVPDGYATQELLQTLR